MTSASGDSSVTPTVVELLCDLGKGAPSWKANFRYLEKAVKQGEEADSLGAGVGVVAGRLLPGTESSPPSAPFFSLTCGWISLLGRGFLTLLAPSDYVPCFHLLQFWKWNKENTYPKEKPEEEKKTHVRIIIFLSRKSGYSEFTRSWETS